MKLPSDWIELFEEDPELEDEDELPVGVTPDSLSAWKSADTNAPVPTAGPAAVGAPRLEVEFELFEPPVATWFGGLLWLMGGKGK